MMRLPPHPADRAVLGISWSLLSFSRVIIFCVSMFTNYYFDTKVLQLVPWSCIGTPELL